jgi:hypothetical protein
MLIETKKIVIGLALLLGILSPLAVSAAGFGGLSCSGKERDYADQALNAKDITEYQKALKSYQDHSCQLGDIFTGFAKVINFLIGAIGLFVVFRLVVSGAQMVFSGGNEGSLKGAKVAAQNALIGLLIVFLSFMIVSTVFSAFAVQIGLESKFTFPYNPFNK